MNQKTLKIFCLLYALLSKEAYSGDYVLAYALKQGLSQGALMLRAQPLQSLLKSPHTPEKLRQSLELTQEVLLFVDEIPMKRGASYLKYVDLDRDWVTQAITVAHKDRLELRMFDFPLVGALPYKGFFSEEDALEEERKFQNNFDVFRRKVPAYSGLGWFSDLLTSNLVKDEYYLIETLFHELVHLNFYFDSQSDFNEAFATWFSYKATEDFLKKAKKVADSTYCHKRLEESKLLDTEISLFISEITKRGLSFYENKARDRRLYFDWIKKCLTQYPSLKGYEKIEWNNAAVLSFSTYTRLVPKIEEYAKLKRLNYKDFLKLILQKGPSIVSEIDIGPKVIPSRCDQIPI